MLKKTRKQNREMNKKVTVNDFLRVQLLIIRELYQKYRFQTTIIIFFSFITLSAQFVELKFLEYMTDTVAEKLHPGDEVLAVALGIVLFLGTLLMLRLISSIYNHVNIKYQNNIVFESEKKLLAKLSHISYEHFESSEFYQKIDIAGQASRQYGNAVYGVTQLFGILLMTVIYGYMLSQITVYYVLIILISILVSIIIASLVTEKQLDFWRKNVSPQTRRNNYFKNVMGSRINQQNIQISRAFAFFSDKYSWSNAQERTNYLKLNFLSITSEIGTLLIFGSTYLVTAFFVGKGVATGRYTIGYFSMVMALLMNFFATLKSFTMFMLNGNWYIKVLDAYYEILSLPNAREACIPSKIDGIRLEELQYKYFQSQTNAINGISVVFRPGEKIAVVGCNGCGKTTMISILLGLLEAYQGKLELGEDIVCTAILQDFGRYQMSIKENIEVGCGGKDIPEEQVVQVLQMVGLFDFVSTLPDGIHTKLGQLEQGIELSQGQWQRLAIARLLVNKKANVWILDEPTAYLDPLAEIEMYRMIYEYAGDRLVFFISHRLGFARRADRILVMSQGRLLEDGTHDALMQLDDGLYREMFNEQKKWFDE